MNDGTAQIFFIGAGPGSVDMLTLRACRLLQNADLVLYDALVSDDVLAVIRRGAQCICVGKRAGMHSVPQDEINRLIVRFCRQNRRVIRLKGGDPSIFGRLDEEIEAVREAGFAYEIVPGITTASAAAARAGIPLTCRGTARRVQFVTAHLRADEPLDLDWTALADPRSSTVFYMARGAAGEIARQLVAAGLPPMTNVLLMTNVSRRDEQGIVSPLRDLAAAVEKLPREAPLVLIVGEVARKATMRDAASAASLAEATAGRRSSIR